MVALLYVSDFKPAVCDNRELKKDALNLCNLKDVDTTQLKTWHNSAATCVLCIDDRPGASLVDISALHHDCIVVSL
jgi:hypothetical protein